MKYMKIPTLFGRSKQTPAPVTFPPITPDTTFSVIGDVHGRFDLLVKLVEQLPPDKSIICVGDMIDRGEQSADVLRFVKEHPNITPIMGNHEQLMMNFLRSPGTDGRRWMRNGGLQTLASFGISGVTETSGEDALTRARDALFDAMGEDLVKWVNQIECIGWSGNVAVVHAGADPSLPLDQHAPDTFIWGHKDFRRRPRTDGFWIIHGHTIVDEPRSKDGVISIDTGAYATGRLTAAIVSNGQIDFVTT